MEKFGHFFAVRTANISQGYHDAKFWPASALWTGSVLSCVLFLSIYLLLQSDLINNKLIPILTHYPELTLTRWAEKFGPLYSPWLGKQRVIIISSADVAKDLLVTTGSIFSSRIANAWLQQKAVSKFTAVFGREANDMVNCLLDASQGGTALVNPQPFAGRCSLNNMLSIAFGIRTAPVDDLLVSTIRRFDQRAPGLYQFGHAQLARS